jgi:hypothetical protein
VPGPVDLLVILHLTMDIYILRDVAQFSALKLR